MSDITSANSILMLGVTNLYPVPQQLQGFAQDDAYDMSDVTTKEVLLGVDGVMSYGYIPQIKEMNVHLQADSSSNVFFEAVYAAEEAAKGAFQFFGIIQQPSVGRVITLTNGVLVGYSPFAGAKKVLQPRKFMIKWNTVIAAAV
jgi:hypothetical protein